MMAKTVGAAPSSSDEAGEDVGGMEDAFLTLDNGDFFPIRLAIITIGRRMDNQLVLNDPRVSRVHAELRCLHGRYVIFDRESSGGTYVNGVRVAQSVLYDGDVISLAGVQLIFRRASLPRPDLNKTATF